MTKMQKSVVIDEEGVYRSVKYDDIIYEWPQEQQQAGVLQGSSIKYASIFRKGWSNLAEKSDNRYLGTLKCFHGNGV